MTMAHMGWTQYTLTVSPQFSQSWRDAHVFFWGIFGDCQEPMVKIGRGIVGGVHWSNMGHVGLRIPGIHSPQPGSARNKADWRPMLELPPVTAAYYCCNFGHIVLGHSGKRVPWDFRFFFLSAILQRFLRPRSFSFHIQHGTPSQFLSNTATKN